MRRRVTIEVDDDLMAEAQELLGAGGLKDTCEAAVREIVRHHRLNELLESLRTGDGFDHELLSPEGRHRMWHGDTIDPESAQPRLDTDTG